VRGMAHIEELRGGRFAIIITEIPYQVNKSSLIERIADLVREGKIDAISDLRDESDRRGMSIVIELKRGAQPRQVLNQLYKFTALQSTFGVQLLALVDGEPRYITLKRSLQIFVEHRLEVITRRRNTSLKKRATGARAGGFDDRPRQPGRCHPDHPAVARRRNRQNPVIDRFKLTDIQAQAILDMQLRRLAALERQKIEDEQKKCSAASPSSRSCCLTGKSSWK